MIAPTVLCFLFNELFPDEVYDKESEKCVHRTEDDTCDNVCGIVNVEVDP